MSTSNAGAAPSGNAMLQQQQQQQRYLQPEHSAAVVEPTLWEPSQVTEGTIASCLTTQNHLLMEGHGKLGEEEGQDENAALVELVEEDEEELLKRLHLNDE